MTTAGCHWSDGEETDLNNPPSSRRRSKEPLEAAGSSHEEAVLVEAGVECVDGAAT